MLTSIKLRISLGLNIETFRIMKEPQVNRQYIKRSKLFLEIIMQKYYILDFWEINM